MPRLTPFVDLSELKPGDSFLVDEDSSVSIRSRGNIGDDSNGDAQRGDFAQAAQVLTAVLTEDPTAVLVAVRLSAIYAKMARVRWGPRGAYGDGRAGS